MLVVACLKRVSWACSGLSAVSSACGMYPGHSPVVGQGLFSLVWAEWSQPRNRRCQLPLVMPFSTEFRAAAKQTVTRNLPSAMPLIHNPSLKWATGAWVSRLLKGWEHRCLNLSLCCSRQLGRVSCQAFQTCRCTPALGNLHLWNPTCVGCEVFGHVGTVAYRRLPALCGRQWVPPAYRWPKALEASRQVVPSSSWQRGSMPSSSGSGTQQRAAVGRCSASVLGQKEEKKPSVWRQHDYRCKEQFPQLYWAALEEASALQDLFFSQNDYKGYCLVTFLYLCSHISFIWTTRERKGIKAGLQHCPDIRWRVCVFRGAWIFKVNTGCAGKNGDCRGKASTFHERN